MTDSPHTPGTPLRIPASALPPRPPRRRAQGRPAAPWIRILFPLAALMIVAVVAVQLLLRPGGARAPAPGPGPDAAESLRAVMLSGDQAPRYRDPAGRFSVAQPEGWDATVGEDAAPFDVRLFGPGKVELSIKVAETNLTLEALKADLRRVEFAENLETHITETNVLGRAALMRNTPLVTDHILMIDLPAEGRLYHLLASVPRESYRELAPYLIELMSTLRVGGGAAPGAATAAPP